MNTLSDGAYYIRNRGFPVTRNKIEDSSLNPKPVFTLPKGSEELVWNIEHHGNGFFLKNGRDPTGVIERNGTELVFAILQPNPDEKPTEWNLLKHIPPGAPHTAQYLIISADDEAKGWVSSEPGTPSEETQIQFRVLIVGKSDPPTYPLNQLFEIVPA